MASVWGTVRIEHILSQWGWRSSRTCTGGELTPRQDLSPFLAKPCASGRARMHQEEGAECLLPRPPAWSTFASKSKGGRPPVW